MIIKVTQDLNSFSPFMASLKSEDERKLYLKCSESNNALKRHGFPIKRKAKGKRKVVRSKKSCMLLDECYLTIGNREDVN